MSFPAKQKNWHNRTTVLYTKYVHEFVLVLIQVELIQNEFVLVLVQVELIWTISRCNQKTDTTAQLYIVH
jgi:hypothetical protein